MENYIVSARKYRPSTFESVVGQRALTTTLKNAIATQKLAHAYLFCGPRGVGKTTCARIFAKTINCMTLLPMVKPATNANRVWLSTNSGRIISMNLMPLPTIRWMISVNWWNRCASRHRSVNIRYILSMRCICSRLPLSTHS